MNENVGVTSLLSVALATRSGVVSVPITSGAGRRCSTVGGTCMLML